MPKSKTTKRHQGVTMESLDSKLDLVLELADENTKDIMIIKGDVTDIKEDVDVVKTDIAVMKGDIEVIKIDITAMKEDIETSKIDIEFIKNNLKKKVDIEEFAALERRVALLEKRAR